MDVTIVDTLPSGTTFVSSTPATCTPAPPVATALVTCNLGSIQVGKSTTETLVVTPKKPSSPNIVAVSSDPDPTIFQTGAQQPGPPVPGTFNWNGFLPPTQNPPAINQATAGSQVPLKFSLGGNFGTDIFASGSPEQQPVDCITLIPLTGSVPTPIPPTGFTLNFNVGSHQYNFNWKSDPGWGGTCRLISLQLNDGTAAHLAYFQFN
jgi:hypothetical protein